MKKYYFRQLNEALLKTLCKRKSIRFDKILPVVKNILKEVKTRGDSAVYEFTTKFDNVNISSLAVTKKKLSKQQKIYRKMFKVLFRKQLKILKNSIDCN